MILACCMSPARSPAEERNRMFATANRTFGTAIAMTTMTTNTTIMISIRLNPLALRRRTSLWGSILILVSNHSPDPKVSGEGGHAAHLGMEKGNFNTARQIYLTYLETIIYGMAGFRIGLGRNLGGWKCYKLGGQPYRC